MAKKAARRKRQIAAPKKAAFLSAYAEVGNVTHAAKIAKCDRGTVYRWLDDPVFAKAFADAGEQATEVLEAEARRRAVDGIDKPVFHQGIQCGTVREYSNTLLIFLLKGRKPEKYRDNVKTEHVGRVGLDHSGGIAVDLHQVVNDIEAKLGADLESIARQRLGVAVPGVLRPSVN